MNLVNSTSIQFGKTRKKLLVRNIIHFVFFIKSYPDKVSEIMTHEWFSRASLIWNILLSHDQKQRSTFYGSGVSTSNHVPMISALYFACTNDSNSALTEALRALSRVRTNFAVCWINNSWHNRYRSSSIIQILNYMSTALELRVRLCSHVMRHTYEW